MHSRHDRRTFRAVHLAGCARRQFDSSCAYQTGGHHGPDKKQVAVMVIGPLAPRSAVAAACDMHALWRRIEFRARVVS
jgi:hypothetical protein